MPLKTVLKSHCQHCGKQQAVSDGVYVHYSPCNCQWNRRLGPPNYPRTFNANSVMIEETPKDGGVA